MLTVSDIHTYYGDSYVLQGVSLAVAPGEVVAILGRNGVGKTTLVRSCYGADAAAPGQDRLPRRNDLRLAGAPHRAERHRLCAAGPAGVSLAHRARTSVGCRPCHRRPHRWNADAVLEMFPRLARAARQPRQQAVGRRAADAGDGARAGHQSATALDGRTVRGPGAADRARARRAGGQSEEEGLSILLVEQQIGFACATPTASTS